MLYTLTLQYTIDYKDFSSYILYCIRVVFCYIHVCILLFVMYTRLPPTSLYFHYYIYSCMVITIVRYVDFTFVQKAMSVNTYAQIELHVISR